jgi:glyoxylase-like metal-dependent hydrolase (beta-lactamase superfamily II)
MRFGDFELSVVRESFMKLDGGAMFGVVPKPLWNKLSPADDRNRISMACNLLLIETADEKVLVETGMGDRWDERERDRYDLRSNVDSANMLRELGVSNDEITVVVISHLHFDHAGGATRIVDGQLTATFPNAIYYAQRGEYDFSKIANARARASYRLDDYEPLHAAGQLRLIDGDTEIVPGIWARITGGHTSHHQIVTFESCGKKGVFFADIIPTCSHITPPWVMGYDHFPLQSCDIKSKWLSQAADEQWLIVFDHEIGVPWGHVNKSDKGKFDFVPLAEETLKPRRAVSASS